MLRPIFNKKLYTEIDIYLVLNWQFSPIKWGTFFPGEISVVVCWPNSLIYISPTKKLLDTASQTRGLNQDCYVSANPTKCADKYHLSKHLEKLLLLGIHLHIVSSKKFIESVALPIRLFLMIIMMPLQRCVVKENYLIALLRNEAKHIFFISGPWLSIAKLWPLSFSALRWRCCYLIF